MVSSSLQTTDTTAQLAVGSPLLLQPPSLLLAARFLLSPVSFFSPDLAEVGVPLGVACGGTVVPRGYVGSCVPLPEALQPPWRALLPPSRTGAGTQHPAYLRRWKMGTGQRWHECGHVTPDVRVGCRLGHGEAPTPTPGCQSSLVPWDWLQLGHPFCSLPSSPSALAAPKSTGRASSLTQKTKPCDGSSVHNGLCPTGQESRDIKAQACLFPGP